MHTLERKTKKISMITDRTRTVIFALGLAALMLTQNAAAQTAASFLRISPNARQVGMGEAFTAMANDYNLLRYNVGGLGILRKAKLSTNFHRWIGDTQQGDIEFSFPFFFGVAGFGLTYFSEGSITALNENFLPTGGVAQSSDLMLSWGFGQQLKVFGNTLSFGAGGKLIRQDLAGFSGTGIGVDVGAVYAFKHISLGATLQNITVSKIKLRDQAELLPETIRGGIALRLPLGEKMKWNIATDIARTRDEDEYKIYTGTELRIDETISLRAGYKFFDSALAPWSVGFGLIMPMQWLANSSTELDYAFAPLDAFDEFSHRFSFTFTFGAIKPFQVTPGIDIEEITRLKEDLANELLAAQEVRRRVEDVEKRQRSIEEDLARKLERIQQIALTSAGKIEIIPDKEDSTLIHMSLRITFDFDRSSIRKSEEPTLRKLVEILNTWPGAKVAISGHTDSIGDDYYNMALSDRRMKSVMRFLSRHGVDARRFFMPVAYGESKPLADNSTEAGRARNRRVDFTIFTANETPPIPEGTAVLSVQALSDTTFAIINNGRIDATLDLKQTQAPPRLIIDIPGVYFLGRQKNYEIVRGIVKRARVGYHPNGKFTRVVFDLEEPGTYAAKTVDNTFLVIIKPKSGRRSVTRKN